MVMALCRDSCFELDKKCPALLVTWPWSSLELRGPHCVLHLLAALRDHHSRGSHSGTVQFMYFHIYLELKSIDSAITDTCKESDFIDR